ncbi:MAG: formimidoylglutamate deiminase [Proteobacteria bacterium]|nr:formimidoylglutamate deiminase [Pseudomonadota bacterium]
MIDGTTVFAPSARLPGGWATDVAIKIDGAGTIATVTPGAKFATAAMTRAPGPVIPGMPNLHSHAHQRAMAGLSEYRASGAGAEDSFWTWRTVMHRFAEQVTPEILDVVAAQLYVEMIKSGYTSVCEFHYVHHDKAGRRYADPAEMSLRLIGAAKRAGIGITLLPVLYANGGYGGQEPNAGQRRFIAEADELLGIIAAAGKASAGDPEVRVGVAPHSPRHAPKEPLQEILSGLHGIDPTAPIHIHVAEQEKDVEQSLVHTGMRPVEWLLENAAVDERWCLVHATHVTADEVSAMAHRGCIVGICPTTEANLGDGLFPFVDFLDAGGRFGIGSDSHISVSPIEELRWLEYGQRLIKRRRNISAAGPGASTAARLFDGALAGGAQAAARPVGGIAVGNRADFLILDADNPLLVGKQGERLLESLLFAGNQNPISEVWVGGRRVVEAGRHFLEEETATAFAKVMRGLEI